ncbi:MAG: hypothetical protein KGI08_09455 [Thaumarchaeota archaeon]|nr:hypothetical protein [Nitrososphaerota archaeon]
MTNHMEQKADTGQFKYLVTFGGGIGEDIWDREIIVKGNDIFEALYNAKYKLDNAGFGPHSIFSIEQQD